MDRGWSLSPHSYDVRKAVNALVRKGEMWVPKDGDPVVVYFGHLEKKAIAKAAATGKPLVSIDASAAAEILLRGSVASVRSPTDPIQPANDPSVPRNNRFIGVMLPANWK